MIYNDIYNLLLTYVFNGAELTPNIDLVCILIATLASIIVIALPFLIVWRIIKIIL